MSTTTHRPDAGAAAVLASLAFAVVGWELLVLLLDAVLALRGWPAVLAHQLLTAGGWLAGTLLLRARGRALLTGRGRPPLRRSLPAAVLAAVLVAGCVAVRWWVQESSQLVAEHAGFARSGGPAGLLTTAQVGYYVAEAGVVSLLVAFAQRAGELRGGRPGVPWGGIGAALTWGAVHVLLQGPAAGAYAVAVALVLGAVHLLVGSWRRTWALAAVLFVL
ncbi:hypothetical protein [Kineococcus sp. SYSU DK002]|uniref:hypothetical protein n=1 Tax=Kineococcus sp. SYSU DK002 TaxID=3383123 RepID=UPI003D7ED808